ncbi:hypothetical protein F4677DRAFT_197952 [Hypoxylon crocopeplum]|nr:hypothetical protein F4677DRAFT_197952 [Hypoxylon crocopeplum]
MASQDQSPQEKYGLSCPSGGEFYICLSSHIRFLGCCETDPCSTGGECPIDKLRPASYTDYPGRHQSCVAPYGEWEWYTCDFSTPKFMGCCSRDPCDEGCPHEDLIQARLDDDDDIAAPFLSSSSLQPQQNPQPSNAISTGRETLSLSPSPSPSPSPTETIASEGTSSTGNGTTEEPYYTSPSRIGLIIGLTMTGVVVLLIVLGVKVWWRKLTNIWEFLKRRHNPSSSPREDDSPAENKRPQDDLQTGERAYSNSMLCFSG